MADEPENHTIRLLQELRTGMTDRFDDLAQRFDDVTMRVDGNTLLLNLLAGLLHQQDERLTVLESGGRAEGRNNDLPLSQAKTTGLFERNQGRFPVIGTSAPLGSASRLRSGKSAVCVASC